MQMSNSILFEETIKKINRKKKKDKRSEDVQKG